MKATAFLTDTSTTSEWYKYKGVDTDYAIGSSTVELFLASLNAKAPSKTYIRYFIL